MTDTSNQRQDIEIPNKPGGLTAELAKKGHSFKFVNGGIETDAQKGTSLFLFCYINNHFNHQHIYILTTRIRRRSRRPILQPLYPRHLHPRPNSNPSNNPHPTTDKHTRPIRRGNGLLPRRSTSLFNANRARATKPGGGAAV